MNKKQIPPSSSNPAGWILYINPSDSMFATSPLKEKTPAIKITTGQITIINAIITAITKNVFFIVVIF